MFLYPVFWTWDYMKEVHMTEVHEGMIKLPVSIIRGGTSKGVYILEEDLPKDKRSVHFYYDKEYKI